MSAPGKAPASAAGRLAAALDLPPVWLLGFMAAAWGVARLSAPLGGWAVWPGVALVAAGLALAVWAALEMRRRGTTVMPHAMPDALVASGPFRLSRNPIYLADLAVLAGWSLALGSPHGVLLAWPLALVLEARFIRPEEARLAARFGAGFAAYRARVRRWL
ncbi:isoprenylcysteine carboxylmethyltransferase family protein [Paralimibaculum aggregatum]|uniref:Isoprenylcysteine carboxylmethyltransferase family protein n=1 Tax=Paralimibaculum aggregatum TaxID=3036245 RepID=A0ABQ6LFW2_9RHOB|nr:isoprenylcysteine carboxylmethyltransferase family protein [Limibaculum sp. NKW23]GMG82217.1 isoprenylcysteine carboxylmethyltransferase family protein [Limibaculum sp. NKW23]